MLKRIVTTVLLTGLIGGGLSSGAKAQQPNSYGQPGASASGWSFNVAPYLWMPTIGGTFNLNNPGPAGGTVTASSSLGFGDIVSHLNFGLMGAADARYDRFSVLTDFIYMNLGGTAAQLRTVNFPGAPRLPITTTAEASQGLNMNAKVWTLAGGYTVVEGAWGNFDAIVGFRYMNVPVRLNYSLGLTLTGPLGGSQTFGGIGTASGTVDLWNGIGGFRGRVRVGDAGFFIPYYFDAGAGGSNFTWQIASGVGYHMNWGDVSLTYRYLTFNQSDTHVLERLWVRGPLLMANFSF